MKTKRFEKHIDKMEDIIIKFMVFVYKFYKKYSNKIIGLSVIAIGSLTLLIPGSPIDTTVSDSTGFIFLLIIGLVAFFTKQKQ